MQKKRFDARIEVSRLEKLRDYAELKKKTMTQIVEELIDSLPDLNRSEDGKAA